MGRYRWGIDLRSPTSRESVRGAANDVFGRHIQCRAEHHQVRLIDHLFAILDGLDLLLAEAGANRQIRQIHLGLLARRSQFHANLTASFPRSFLVAHGTSPPVDQGPASMRWNFSSSIRRSSAG